MTTRVIIALIVFVSSAFLFIGASKKENDPYKPTYLKLEIPKGWPKPAKDIFANNPLTEQGFQLGKKLFYDGRLSKDGNFPCASCHQQFAAFATYEHDFSHGINNLFTTRNAPALFNLAWMPLLHWDGGINHIEVQPLAPLTAHNEMGETIDSVLKKLRKDTAYPKMFKAAFGTPLINSQRMLKALAQFTGSILSYNSKYDKVLRGEDKFTPAEERGYTFFKNKCAACHAEPLFTDNSFRNNGLSVNAYLNDYGRMRITNNKNDSLKFKVPSLRNVTLTFPYMHDGRYYSIGQAIDHYRTGIVTTQPTLDTLLKNRIAINNAEKNDLIYFLFTLSDTTLTRSTRFAMH
ncbi:cytochrome-c peroxidase [Ferruginibacter sp. SUN106]|uniref:cytochrome-c peroxidase n=1 Tax=Ferruginibacter sp. SUN106 TaxID=2978348 RepID=UPI003D36188C